MARSRIILWEGIGSHLENRRGRMQRHVCSPRQHDAPLCTVTLLQVFPCTKGQVVQDAGGFTLENLFIPGVALD